MRWQWLSLALVACGTASEDLATSTSPALTAEEAADAGSSVGPFASVDETPLTIAGPARQVVYTPSAPFTALSFVAKEGQDLAFLVDSRTDGAKPTVWITDNQFVTLASKAATSGTAFVRFQANRTGIFYLVLREATSAPSMFLIQSFDYTPPPPPPPEPEEDAGAE